MSVEIEAKMRLADINGLLSRLSEAGGKRYTEMIEVNAYYDTPNGSLLSQGQGLRLRVETHQEDSSSVVTLTHKGSCASGPIKSRSEVEVIVDDASRMVELLRALGFTSKRTFEKHRRRWKLGSCWVDIDSLPYIGDFVEIEGPSEDDVLATRRQLGLDATPLVPGSYIELLEMYLVKNHITTDYIGLNPPPRS